jgi:hypothetical protein
MAIAKFQRIQTSDTELNLLQNRLAETLDALTSNDLVGGQLIRSTALKAGSNQISHGLGRNYVSFLSGNFTSPASLTAGASRDPSKFINLIATAACVVDLYVY